MGLIPIFLPTCLKNYTSASYIAPIRAEHAMLTGYSSARARRNGNIVVWICVRRWGYVGIGVAAVMNCCKGLDLTMLSGAKNRSSGAMNSRDSHGA